MNVGSTTTPDAPVVVIGGGPAGLTAAFALSGQGRDVVVFEAQSRVGGLAQTAEHNGFRFDIGGHRFFTKSRVIQDLWRDVLGPDFLRRPRLSRIFYDGKFFQYPLRALNVVGNLGIWTSAVVLTSYAAARVRPIANERSFADWVTNRFGRRLYLMFFKTYTEKVWGIPCEQISADWAAQRIMGLTLQSAVASMFRLPRRDGKVIKTLINEFEYPRLGPGMMWERVADLVTSRGGRVVLNTRVERVHHDGRQVTAVDVASGGTTTRVPASHVISTAPMPQLVEALTPALPEPARRAAGDLRHRGFLVVALMLAQPEVFPDNWIYVHDPSVRVGRIQNFKNWSPEMVPDPSWTCLGLEYFCNPGDDVWNMTDADLVALAGRELGQIGLADPQLVRDGVVIRMPHAYPIYDEGYQKNLTVIRDAVAPLSNLQLVGRNGMHRYNNQDHSMLTALMAVANMSGAHHDLWAVNADGEYHEEGDGTAANADDAELRRIASTQPLVPTVLNSRGD